LVDISYYFIYNANMLDAYTAGLFDGEGSVIISRRGSRSRQDGQRSIYYHLAISVANTHYGVIAFLERFYGGCINNGKPYRGKPIWFWTLHSENASQFLDALLPWLIIKKEEAKIGIEFQNHMNSHTRPGRGHSIPQDVIDIRESFRSRIVAARKSYSRTSHEQES
jgi:hypothetical protein